MATNKIRQPYKLINAQESADKVVNLPWAVAFDTTIVKGSDDEYHEGDLVTITAGNKVRRFASTTPADFTRIAVASNNWHDPSRERIKNPKTGQSQIEMNGLNLDAINPLDTWVIAFVGVFSQPAYNAMSFKTVNVSWDATNKVVRVTNSVSAPAFYVSGIQEGEIGDTNVMLAGKFSSSVLLAGNI
jgi:hypothetical protein